MPNLDLPVPRDRMPGSARASSERQIYIPPPYPHKVLLIGGGGREHAIAWKLAQSPQVAHIYVAPGNAGIAQEDKVSLLPSLDIEDFKAVAQWCISNRIGMVVIGPEDPLALGIVDELNNYDIPTFGPRRAAANIEASKHFAKSFMERHHIPTARYKTFCKPHDAKLFIESAPYPALVVKASGLAAGKGVIVASSKEEAMRAVDSIFENFEDAAETIVVEELLEGEEVSVLAFSDGHTTIPLLPAQDHKRIYDGDNGPNTGGMGAYCPCPLLNQEDLDFVKEEIIKKTVQALRSEGVKYCGILYAGLMLTREGPKVLEFNCRFGDPETQVLLPLMESDLYEAFEACVQEKLDQYELKWKRNMEAVGVVMASAGYPGSYAKGKEIKNLDEVNNLPGHIVFHAGTSFKDEKIVTSGGRVLIAVALGQELALAAAKALKAAQTIKFDGAQFRKDIAKKGIARAILSRGHMTYKGAGVDIDAGDSLVKNITTLIGTTKREGCCGGIGDFGGFFDPRAAGYRDPMLVSGTDGVGTKLKIAEEMKIHDTVGIDLVAMCVNDILAHAAEPLYFLDYFACGKLDVDTTTKVVIGITEGCRQAGCALIGGETAEMPGVYERDVYDLAGFAVGAVERGKQLPLKDKMMAGDIVLGLGSSGLHSNGFSLVRKVAEKLDLKYTDPCPFGNDNKRSLGEVLLTPTKIYVKQVLSVLRSGKVKAFAHITGGGLTENIPRVLPKHLGVELEAKKWPIHEVYGWIAGAGVDEKEMLRTFNCGLGAIMIIGAADQHQVMSQITDEHVYVVGHVRAIKGEEESVVVRGFTDELAPLMKPHMKLPNNLTSKRRVGVLISGTGTNLQSLINHTTDPNKGSMAEIVLVISNKAGVEGLTRASNSGIATKVVSNKDFPDREAFDRELIRQLEDARVEIVCLAGFMRILSPLFVKKWRGKLLNIHPSLLPSFKGAHAHKDALDAGVKVTGCTVHFVEEEVDAGGIICQEAVPIKHGDTLEILQERVKVAEHKCYPKALEMLARNKLKLMDNGKISWNI